MKTLLPCLLWLAWASSSASGAEIIAHRGASADAPENTLASVRLGFDQKADAVEIDIHLSRDNQIVVLHDPDTKRTTGQPGVVRELTLEQMRQLDAGSWKGIEWVGQRIPTLEEVLAAVPERKRLFIEIKCGPEVIPVLQQALAQTPLKPSQLVLIGFDYATMVQAKKQFPHLLTYWLASFKQDKETGAWSPTVEELITKAKTGGMDGLNLSFKGPLDAAGVRQIKSAGLGIFVWTVNDAAVAKQLVEAGVAGITTDRPAWLRQELAQ